ncbi:MAG: SPFH domain-containing protein [Oscillospiraceae bacterium]|nr:SPFH domain-containing protein [Oscillospiraceae bacterium]
MGIIKAVAGAASGMMEDQWKEVFWCDALSGGDMLVRGVKQKTAFSGNTGDDHHITEGSLIVVNEGQCALVVDNGVVVAAYTEPGEHVFHAHRSPKALADEFLRRVSYGGDAPYLNQYVYYINLHEFINHPFAVTLPARFGVPGGAVTEPLTVRGMYSCKIADPVLFYKTVTGNVERSYQFCQFREQLDNEVRDAILEAASALCEKGLAVDQIGRESKQLCKQVRERMKNSEAARLGIELSSIVIGGNVVRSAVERSQTYEQHQDMHVVPKGTPLRYTPPEPQSYKVYRAEHLPGIGKPAEPPKPVDTSWICRCGCRAESRFCPECGSSRPWKCVCGAENHGKFCTECGKPMAVE